MGERQTADNLPGELGAVPVLHQLLAELVTYENHALVVEVPYENFLKPERGHHYAPGFCARAITEIYVLRPWYLLVAHIQKYAPSSYALSLTGPWAAKRLKAVRFGFIHLAGRVIAHARQLVIRLSRTHPAYRLLLGMRQPARTVGRAQKDGCDIGSALYRVETTTDSTSSGDFLAERRQLGRSVASFRWPSLQPSFQPGEKPPLAG